MHVIGITGGVGSGKSVVLRYLEQQPGIVCAEADAVAKELILPGGACYEKIVALLGEDVLEDASAGKIDKKKMAARIYASEELRQEVNGIIHPEVKQEILRRIYAAERNGVRWFFIEAALLLEDHYDAICDEIWYIRADTETRIARLMESRGYSREKAVSIIEAQKSDDEFVSACDRVIDNSATVEACLWEVWTAMQHIELANE